MKKKLTLSINKAVIEIFRWCYPDFNISEMVESDLAKMIYKTLGVEFSPDPRRN